MFRPYSLTSIAAWTVGSLAGNYAYYGTKARASVLKISKASCPPGVRFVIDKLKAIEREAKSLVDGLNSVFKVQGQVNVSPIIQAFAYNDWLMANGPKIRAEIDSAYGASMSEGYLWPSTVIQDAQCGLDSLLGSVNAIVSDERSGFNKFLSTIPDPDMQRKVVEILNQRQQLCTVDEDTCAMIDSNDGDFILR